MRTGSALSGCTRPRLRSAINLTRSQIRQERVTRTLAGDSIAFLGQITHVDGRSTSETRFLWLALSAARVV